MVRTRRARANHLHPEHPACQVSPMWLLATDQRSSVGGERDVPAFVPSCQQKSDLRRNVVMPGRLSLALKMRPIDMVSNTAAPVVVSSYRAGLGHLELSTASNVGFDSMAFPRFHGQCYAAEA